MKMIFDIPEVDYNYAKQQVADGITNPLKIFIASGTPIPDNATVCDIEQIRADIEASRYGLVNDGLDLALKIIDKHIK